MKIRILASGEVRHIDNSTGTALVSAGLAEVLTKDDLNLPKPGDYVSIPPTWEVLVKHVNQTGRSELVIRMTRPGFVADYFGEPQFANAFKSWPGPDGKTEGGRRWLNGFGMAVPDEILEQYTKQWKRNRHLRAEAAPGVAAANMQSVQGTRLSPPDMNYSNGRMAEELAAKNAELAAKSAALNNPEVAALADDDSPTHIPIVIE